ncbi:MAG: asparagine synthase-related protein, partial [Burkholderiales bacterium]
SKEVKVVLAGQGADEVFGGYFWYPLMDAEAGPPVERFGRHYFDRDHGLPWPWMVFTQVQRATLRGPKV